MSSSVKNPTSFRRFALSALPEFWMFQLLASLFLFPLSRLVWRFVRALTAKSGALTSSNYLRFLASWRAPVLLVLLFLLVMLYLLFELLAPIFLCNALLSGKQLRYRTALLDGLRSLRKFASPRGLLFLFYLAVLTPLTGVGFHISLTKKLYIPNFISEVIDTTPLYFLLYLLLMAVLFWLGYRMLFFLHAAILESRTPGAAFRRSSELVTSNRLRIAKELLPLLLFLAFIRLLAAMGASLFFTALLSFVLSFLYAPLFAREQHTKLIAHRTGGYLAPENSVAGIVAAENAGAYGSETDVQRTSDGYYVINHDDNFKRLAGVNRTPQSMTFLEVRGLTLTDPHFPAEPYPVATLSDLLDACRGKEKLFIELKGVTADKKMADDVVRIVREKNMVSEVVIISLSYRVINYVETHYPEFDTGVLFFAGVGNLPKLNCDILLLEEESVSNARIAEAHAAGKQIGVWTVNDSNGLSRFLDSEVDYIITDDIRLAKETEQDLLSRMPYEVFEDRLGNFWDFMFF